MTEGTPAGIWIRVSDATQWEDNQLPDAQEWCGTHGYDVRRVFRVHGKSAWAPGKLDGDKQAVLSAIRSGVITVVVVWSVDRWSRGGIADLLDGIRAVREAGGRVEFVKDQVLNADGPTQELLLALLGWVAKWESEHRSDRTRAGQNRRRAEGEEIQMGGHAPLGWKLADGRRVRDEAALKIVAEVFERSARGESTATIADWMRRSGYQRRDNTIADLLRNDAYVEGGVVTAALAKAATDALEERRTGCARRISAEDYSAMIWCRCGKVMHRKMSGAMPAKGVEATRYYRCSAHEGKPVPMVRADDTDVLVEYVFGNDWQPWFVPVRTGGDTRDADRAKLLRRLSHATTRAQTDAIWDEIEKVETREPSPETVEWVPSGKSRGDRWHELQIPERRAWLASEGTRIVCWNVKSIAADTVEADEDGNLSWARGKVRMVVEHDDGDAEGSLPGSNILRP